MQPTATTSDCDRLLDDYREVRNHTVALCEPLAPEDMVVQSMPETSPTKWHLAHVTWFFETIVLAKHLPGYRQFDERVARLFNSYYETIGKPFPRDRRGMLSRPTVDEVMAYRVHVDEAMAELLSDLADDKVAQVAALVTVGLHHEQQHQELMMMDILHVLSQNPLQPAYRENGPIAARDVLAPASQPDTQNAPRWIGYAGGDVDVGADGKTFCYDNERPRHRVRLEPFELRSHLVTNEEYRAFLVDGGYRRPELWMADGWELVKQSELQAPLYWERDGDRWCEMTLDGLQPTLAHRPVRHISFYEADAYARWAGCRLPSEHEWEHAADQPAADGQAANRPAQMFDEAWQWTSSPYGAYPGFRAFEGSLGEYNGKFMINQIVLRGGCSETPSGHSRSTYRNFYYPHQRWMFSGIRLAR